MARLLTLRSFTIVVAAAACLTASLSAAPVAGASKTLMTVSSTKPATLTPKLIRRLSQNVNRAVIVVMKSQPLAVKPASHASAIRSQAIAKSQSPLLRELRQVHATHIKSFSLVNSFSATVSAGEMARLKANSAVAKVVPDGAIRLAQPEVVSPPRRSTKKIREAALTPNVIPGACGANGAVQLSPEGLALTQTDSDNTADQTARRLGITGAGVKVAYIADGVNPNNINFIRSNNSSAFVDYQDFTGDGPGQPTNGDEAFLDANTIAGQGIQTYDVSNFSAQPDPSACNIRIEGVAPGASLIGLDVFGTFEVTTESNFLQAINYAVQTDHVNVINESFGSNPFPDITALDVTKQFNDAAVAAGTVVTVSSGDAGATNTIGSPASDPNVISVGASTQFQMYAQTNYAAADYFATNGWLSDNASALSSSGFTESGSTINLVAPGDLSFASCDASPVFAGCVNFQGQSSPVEEAGGTSESSPFVAGASALVIQAYRQTHGGATPAPALVKEILVSTATDLGIPAQEQGAGLLNSYKAVLLAESVPTGDGTPSPTGDTLLTSVDHLNAVDTAGSRQHSQISVTNEGAHTQLLDLSGRTLGPDQNVQTGTVSLVDGTSPQFTNYQGLANNYATFTFNVAANADRLDASIAYPGNPANGNNNRVRLILVDPQGRFAAHSLPQGVSNFGNVDVRNPAAGTWTGVIFGDTAALKGTNGAIPWRVATQEFVPFGKVSPSTLTVHPGETQTFTFTVNTPSAPGDSSGSIVISPDFGLLGDTSIPVTLRSLVNVAHGGSFNGMLTGGNGRAPGEGQVLYYEFPVGNHVNNITAGVSLSGDFNDSLGAYLVSPSGDALGYGQNSINGTQTGSLTAYAANPTPGTWTLVVDQANAIVGDMVSQSFTGSIQLNDASVSAPGLPTHASTKLPAGTPVTIPVSIKNNGLQAEDVFVDPRLNQRTTVTLAPFTQATGLALPLVVGSPQWFVPTETANISVAATASLPVMFDFGLNTGDPDVATSGCSTSNSAMYASTGGTVAPGFWFATPSECGPYPSVAPAGVVSMAMSATIKSFDPAITSSTGDLMQASLNPATTFSPVVINPGQTATVNVTITPSGASGTQVNGTLYVDDFLTNIPPYGQRAGDEIVGLPYAYVIK